MQLTKPIHSLVMNKLPGLIWCVLYPLLLPAQEYTLGWEGEKLISDAVFLDISAWNCNQSDLNAGDSCYVTADTSLQLHWRFGSGIRGKFSQCYQHLASTLNISDKQIIGIDVHGAEGKSRLRHVELKFESGSTQASYTWENLAGLNRWCENLVVLKSQFSNGTTFRWDSITVISFAVTMNSESTLENEADSGIVAFCNLMAASADEFIRADETEFLTDFDVDELESIRLNAAQAIKGRQNPNGLLTTWLQDGSSWLYGQGLALRALTEEGEWNGAIASNEYALAAEKLAQFLAANQSGEGYWPRAWNALTGNILVNLEGNNTVWMGDFPWIPGSLANYYRKSGDGQVLSAILKAKTFLYDLIEETGKVNTINVSTRVKYEVSNYEGYAATLYCLLEFGDTTKAKQVMDYVMYTGWDDQMRMWKEGPGSSRPVLLVNTWLAALAASMHYESQALEALSMTGKLLYTRGPDEPWGFDGVGPIATWYEGTLSYIAAAGPGSNMLFARIKNHINADGSVPAYNENLGSVAGIWAVDWSSLDATSWLYFAAARKVPFGYTGSDPDLFSGSGERENKYPQLEIQYFDNRIYIIDSEYNMHRNYLLELYSMDGKMLGSGIVKPGDTFVNIPDLSSDALTAGYIYLVVLGKGNQRRTLKFLYHF